LRLPRPSMLPLRFPRLWLTLGWLLVALALLACLAPSGAPGLDSLFAINDKVAHAGGYTALMVWFAGIYARSRYVWIVVGLFAMGVSVELLQGWMSMGRNRDFADVAANSAGIAVGVALSLLWMGGWVQRLETFLLAGRRER